ncbi:MAG: CheR family methyltransferase, partial [Pseudomonadota bacterium]
LRLPEVDANPSRRLERQVRRAGRHGVRDPLPAAGCSTGEEPYSLALAFLDEAPELADQDVKILATDIDSNVMEEARKGAYTEDIVSPVEPRLLQRFFETGWGPNADRYVVGDDLRALVTFKSLNLMQPWPMAQRFDVIMCRNVVIYFDEPTKAVLWQRFADLLNPGGHLFIGHSERVHGPARRLFEPAGLTTYRKLD